MTEYCEGDEKILVLECDLASKRLGEAYKAHVIYRKHYSKCDKEYKAAWDALENYQQLLREQPDAAKGEESKP